MGQSVPIGEPLATEPRFWVVGGRYVENGRHLPWPQVYGPCDQRAEAEALLRRLREGAEASVRYDLLCELPDAR
jgi:hypothetical protein